MCQMLVRGELELRSPTPSTWPSLLYTNTSQTGMGAHLQDLTALEMWTLQEKFHINICEMKTVPLALNAF